MSGVTAMGVMAAAAVAGTAASIYNGQQQKSAAKDASRQAQANAAAQEKKAEQDMNRANQKKPDSSALLGAAMESGKAGNAGTLLTGTQGVDPNALNLGKNTLLGQ